jgi:hypothetical protein
MPCPRLQAGQQSKPNLEDFSPSDEGAVLIKLTIVNRWGVKTPMNLLEILIPGLKAGAVPA